MTTVTAGTPSVGSPLVHQQLDANKKRPRAKNVTWATQDKLNQVRLFAAEDAPSLSGSVLQDLLEAKKTRFMHALIPVSADDLPPGFEGVATKRARLDATAILAMVAQITWRSPERFLYNPSWQVAVGDESFEVTVQGQREVRVLEAVYPRPSAIPSSPTEPQEAPPEFEGSKVPQIPLIPIEDEEDGMEEDNISGGAEASKSVSSPPRDFMLGGIATLNHPPGYSPPKDAQNPALGGQLRGLSGSSSAAGQFNPDLTTAFFKNADPDVAAAAAAAYAVLKAKESGTLIDHDLLIKILSNPLLIETLTASNPSLRKQFGDAFSNMSLNRETANGNGIKSKTEPFAEGSYIGAAGSLNSHIMQERQRYDSSEGKVVLGLQGSPITQVWGLNANALANSQGRAFPVAGAHEQLSATKGMLGQAKGAFGTTGPPGRSYPLPRQDISRELIQQHGMAGMISNEAQLRHSTAPMAFDEAKMGHDLERYRLTTVPGSKGQTWLGNTLSVPSAASISRNNIGPQDRPAGTKIKRQCFFFNTPRGCRNGIHCNFLHESAPEKPHTERTNPDVVQQVKTSKVDTEDTEAK